MRKTALSLGLGAILGATLVATSPAATAAETGTRSAAACTFTLYETGNFRGGSYSFSGNDSDLGNNYWNSSQAAGKVNDDANAARNRCAHRVDMYEHSGYRGQSYGIQRNSEDASFVNNGFENKASSLNGF
ncbi:peptidase inhibitor family I36 protein [Streptomyces sp. SYSU K217416]